MSASQTSKSTSNFICACEDWMRNACAGEPFPRQYEGKTYCVLHAPCSDKSQEFDEAFHRKLANHDFDFQGVRFPNPVSLSIMFNKETKFRSAIFHADVEFDDSIFTCDADFASVTFMASASFRFAHFEGDLFFDSASFRVSADFTKCEFRENAYFTSVGFKNAGFGSATFVKCAHFTSSKFKEAARFNGTIFGAEAHFVNTSFYHEARFETATFQGVANFISSTFKGMANFNATALSVRGDYSHANFLDHVRFAEKEGPRPPRDSADLDLQFVRYSIPEHIAFHSVTLRPHWFVNVDPTKFDFVSIEWSNLLPQKADGSRRTIFRHRWHRSLMKEELNCLTNKGISSPHQLLAITCRRLAVNAEENYRYTEASEFRYWSMEIRRRHESDSGLSPTLHSLYYLVSSYGEGIGRAFFVLVGIWLAFAIAYLITGHVKVASALNYSFQVITLQKPDKPTGFLTPLLVSLETILGPVQAALLALAIRRKFMR